MRERGFLFTPEGEPRLLVPGLVGVIAAFVVALALITFTSRPRTEEQRAESLMRSGRPAQAEAIYARLVRERPAVPLILSLLEAHDRGRLLERVLKLRDEARNGGGMGLPDVGTPMAEDALDRLLSELPEDVALVGRFSRGLADRSIPEAVRLAITEGATREPPLPWANHLLGREASHEAKHSAAAAFFETEGIHFPERRADVDTALQIWITLDDWDTLRDRLSNPRVFAAAGPQPKYRLAVHDQDWRSAARWIPAIWAPSFGGTGLVMSAISAFGWAFFLARLGRLGQRVAFRLPMYFVAFVLGMASVLPTVLLIAFEEAKLHLVETGDPARDILYFVFGVGLREEAAKLLVFLPLLPILRRWGTKLDVLVCGAMVGLGFAAEENLNYLAQENLQTGLGRFLTANFFHMAMTGTLASALDDALGPRRSSTEASRWVRREDIDHDKESAFMRTSLFVVGIHGAYDFLLSHEDYGGSYLAMTAFVLLSRMFLEAVDRARPRVDRGITPLHAFVFAVALVTGVSLAFATLAVGPKAALLVMGSGLVGEAIVVYVFVRTLQRM